MSDVFQQERPRLMALAYRLAGSRADAEDLVQEAWLRWQSSTTTPDSVPAYLARIVVNLSMDRWRDLKRQREHYSGTWLPEPWGEACSTGDNPEHGAEKHRLLSTAWLVLLEKLNPVERAVFVLREAFDYSFADIAGVVARSEVNCRQLDRRARQHLQADGLRFVSSQEQQLRLLQRFVQAADAGDVTGLHALFSEDIRLYSDGGGEVTAVLRVLYGLTRVSDFFGALFRHKPADFRLEIRRGGDAEPALWQWWNGTLIGVTTLACEGEKITAIFNQRCPSKLRRARLEMNMPA